MTFVPPTTMTQVAERERAVITQVYAWMTAGLLVTGAIANYAAGSAALMSLIFGNPITMIGLVVCDLALVIGLTAAIGRLSSGVATGLFLLYSMLNGLMLSTIFLVYTQESIASTFFITGGTFGVMSAYGYFTRRDLTTLGNVCIMALLGLILASVVNMFFHNPQIYWLTTYLGVLIFVGLIAYDTQRIKAMASAAFDDTSTRRIAILGALRLYLDFINLFLRLLSIFGRRR